MSTSKTVKILSIIVTAVGIMVMIGWVFDIPILTSILPQWVTMKFSTALSFFLSGVTLYLIAMVFSGKKEIARAVLPIPTLLILLLMATLLVSVFVGIRTGIEDLFVKEAEGAVKTTTPGRPSAGTMFDFILISVAGILTMYNAGKFKNTVFGIGFAVLAVGGVGVLGYIINAPILYYTISGWSTAMALHTAILFVLLGVGLVLVGKGNSNKNTTE